MTFSAFVNPGEKMVYKSIIMIMIMIMIITKITIIIVMIIIIIIRIILLFSTELYGQLPFK